MLKEKFIKVKALSCTTFQTNLFLDPYRFINVKILMGLLFSSVKEKSPIKLHTWCVRHQICYNPRINNAKDDSRSFAGPFQYLPKCKPFYSYVGCSISKFTFDRHIYPTMYFVHETSLKVNLLKKYFDVGHSQQFFIEILKIKLHLFFLKQI